jgi:hypothetical protein
MARCLIKLKDRFAFYVTHLMNIHCEQLFDNCVYVYISKVPVLGYRWHQTLNTMSTVSRTYVIIQIRICKKMKFLCLGTLCYHLIFEIFKICVNLS